MYCVFVTKTNKYFYQLLKKYALLEYGRPKNHHATCECTAVELQRKPEFFFD